VYFGRCFCPDSVSSPASPMMCVLASASLLFDFDVLVPSIPFVVCLYAASPKHFSAISEDLWHLPAF
jgi:hypothetical protein